MISASPRRLPTSVAVMYAGRVIEYGSVRDVLLHAKHPYTLGLMASTGQQKRKRVCRLNDPWQPAGHARAAAGCSFAPRCNATAPECLAGDILMVTLSDARAARCVRLEKPPVT